MAVRFTLPAVSLLLILSVHPALAQRRVSADVEVKTATKGQVSTIRKSVFSNSNGRLVTVFRSPRFYYSVSNSKGEIQLYDPSSNEVLSQYDPLLSSSTELVTLFMSGHIDDLGLGYFGYKAAGSSREDGYVKKRFKPSDPQRPEVDIVYENFLPIYCEYISPEGKVISRKYLSDYQRYGRFVLPQRITDISYGKGNDSTVVRTLYSSVRVDQDAPEFDFQVPSDAKPMKMPAQ